MAAGAQELYYDYIVIGLGGVGSGALYWLSKKAGKNVLGLEQFELGHEKGGSQDVSRIIRLMYFDDRYTKLTPDTFKAWDEVERESGLKLYHITGGLDLTRKDCARADQLEQYAKAMDRQNIKYERLSSKGIMQKYPQFTLSDDVIGLYQAQAGIVDPGLANSVHIQLARGRGATVIDKCPVLRIEPTVDGGAKIYTPRGVFRCRRVVVAAGAWINHVLGSVGLHIPIMVTQEQVTYYATPHMKKFTKENFPIFIWHDTEQDFYGLPIYSNSGYKMGIDSGGPVVSADSRNFNVDPVRERACTEFLQKNIPQSVGPVLFSKTCLYALTRDHHFIIDTLASRGLPQISICCGAGHIYKFASLAGKILSELAADGQSQYDVSGFNLERDAVTDPNFKPTFKVTFRRDQAKL